jgi:hypothetical protein
VKGAVFTILAVIYATLRAAHQVGELEETQPLKTQPEDEEGAKSDENNDNPDEPVAYHFTKFHLVFALGAMYLAMLMTDWSTGE